MSRRRQERAALRALQRRVWGDTTYEDHVVDRARRRQRRVGIIGVVAGAQMLLESLLARTGAKPKDLRRLDPPCLTGPDLAASIRAGNADCGIATRAAARSAGLDFVPLLWESFDLLTLQRSFFRPSMQALIAFLRDKRLARRAAELTGYDVAPAGQIRFAP